MRRRSTARSALVLMVCGLLAVTVGCSTAAPAPAPDAASKLGTVKLGFSAWPGWFPWQVAAEKGLFAANGLTVEPTYFDSYTDSLNALAAGKLDANSQTLNDTLSSVSGGAKETVVLVNGKQSGGAPCGSCCLGWHPGSGGQGVADGVDGSASVVAG
ncbi:MAG: ABC transporter substrate-binding protein, partial [Pseudonocardia sp.]